MVTIGKCMDCGKTHVYLENGKCMDCKDDTTLLLSKMSIQSQRYSSGLFQELHSALEHGSVEIVGKKEQENNSIEIDGYIAINLSSVTITNDQDMSQKEFHYTDHGGNNYQEIVTNTIKQAIEFAEKEL